MIGAIVYQITSDLSEDEVKKAGIDQYFVDHTTGVYPDSAAGVSWTAFNPSLKKLLYKEIINLKEPCRSRALVIFINPQTTADYCSQPLTV